MTQFEFPQLSSATMSDFIKNKPQLRLIFDNYIIAEIKRFKMKKLSRLSHNTTFPLIGHNIKNRTMSSIFLCVFDFLHSAYHSALLIINYAFYFMLLSKKKS